MNSQQCQVCGEVFMSINFVMSHISSHSRKEIYECLVSLKSSLEIFMKQYFALKEHVNLTLTPENYTKDDDENDYYNRQNGMWNSKTTENNHEKESTEYRFEPENRNPETLTGGKDKHNDEENFVDLRDIEIKTENSDTNKKYGSCSSGSVTDNNTSSVFMGDNSTLDPKQDNSDCNSGEINMQENLNNLKRNHEMGSAVPISIIDLSQNDGDDGRIKKSKQFEILYAESPQTDNQAISIPDIKEKEDFVQNLMYITPNLNNINIKKENINRPKIKPVQHLTGKTIQMLAKELSVKAAYISPNFSETTCLECGRTFATKFVLRRHMMSHTGERTHSCPVCGKGFIGKQNMMVHVRVHTGEKPYKCSYCGQQFSQYGTLYRHKKRHMASGDIKNANISSV